MKHIQIEVAANEHQQEELIALLDDYCATGFEQQDDWLIAYFDLADVKEGEIKEVLQGYHFNWKEVEEKNWNEEWEKDFQPVVVDDFVAVRAHFHAPINGVQHEIIITPKMSFGTGHHATTYMMMAQMRNIDFKNKTVFDFGTGTGILSILAKKLGAAEVIAIDVDDWSIENTHENIDRNNCSGIAVSLSSQLPSEQFDIVLANINRNVILDYMNGLAACLTNGAKILFSGLLIADEEVINTAAKEEGLLFVNRMDRNGWLSLLYINTK